MFQFLAYCFHLFILVLSVLALVQGCPTGGSRSILCVSRNWMRISSTALTSNINSCVVFLSYIDTSELLTCDALCSLYVAHYDGRKLKAARRNSVIHSIQGLMNGFAVVYLLAWLLGKLSRWFPDGW